MRGLDNNGAALIVAMAIPMSYFAWEANKRWYRWGFLLVIPILVHALMLSFSRGGMVALGVTAIPVWFRTRHKWLLAAWCICAWEHSFWPLPARNSRSDFFRISKNDAG